MKNLVAIPCFNEEDNINQCIDSLLGKLYKKIKGQKSKSLLDLSPESGMGAIEFLTNIY